MSQRMNYVVGFIMAGTTLFWACQSAEVLPANNIAVQAGQSISTASGIVVTADSVNVSICPANASCFAPNNASATLRLAKGSQRYSVRLFAWIPNYNRRTNTTLDSTGIDIEGQRYKVILRDGRYVGSSTNKTGQQAIIEVSLLD